MSEEHEIQIREVASEEPQGERLQESVVADIAASVAAAGGIGAMGFAGVGAYYQRASYLLQRDQVERDDAELRAAIEAENAELRRELEIENRMLRAQFGGLEGLDAYDAGEPFSFGPEGGYDYE